MLDAETKRRIDTARDILVGKVPDPKSQVEQITIALIYKFMDDMDAESEEMGGDRKFFAGDFARYGWAKLMRSGLGGHETLNLYGEAIDKMPENPGIPLLFRDIFKNAYLPYRDPETLRMFLKVIDEFTYDHSERLGDAFEYLLSVLGSQGDAGQFRTPRHIIDFIVEILDPKKNEKVLDPACGTAGFLISSYKHILRANTDGEGNSTLTPEERGRLAQNFSGYDISPDMVRLSLVNLYLHGFVDPHIYEYDSLTSQDRWNEYADVILANPPFMSPKGGIRPHNRFSVQSKRSEVLFVDYMAEHLTPGGRAGIIVPEGIIFQSQTAYKQLRKLLVEEYLVAVISLPAGVFNPYSGVKTSILILDKSLARRASTIAFFKVENDGFGLGAQRREIDKNDLPHVFSELTEYLHILRTSDVSDSLKTAFGLVIKKERIARSEDFSLSAERYRENGKPSSRFPIVSLGEVAEVISGQSPPGESYNEVGTGEPFYQGKSEFGQMFIGEPAKWTTDPQRFAESGDIVMSVRAPVGPVNLTRKRICIGRGLAAIRPVEAQLLTAFGFYVLRSMESDINGNAGAAFASINGADIKAIRIPLPPLNVQKEIVAEIEGYQKVIDGARAVVDNYRPRIPANPSWPLVGFAEVTSTIAPPAKIQKADYGNTGRYPIVDQSQAEIAGRTDDPAAVVDGRDGLVIFGDHTCAVKFINEEFAQGADGIKIIKAGEGVIPKFLYYYMLSYPIEPEGYNRHFSKLNRTKIAVPPLAEQRAIVSQIEAEQALVAANVELIGRMERKIESTLARVWGEDESEDAEK